MHRGVLNHLSGLSDHGNRLGNNRGNCGGVEHAVGSASVGKFLHVRNGILLERIERDIGTEFRCKFPSDGIHLGENHPAAALLAEHDMVDSHDSAADYHNGIGKLQIGLSDAVDTACKRLGQSSLLIGDSVRDIEEVLGFDDHVVTQSSGTGQKAIPDGLLQGSGAQIGVSGPAVPAFAAVVEHPDGHALSDGPAS